MFQKNNLYSYYKERAIDLQFSFDLPEITKKTTLQNINYGINECEYWNCSLDLGSGNGHYTAALSGKFKKCVGIDLDMYTEQKILSERFPHISFFNGKIEDFKTDTTFDFILLADIFEHIPDITAFVKKISGLQNKGGIAYILTPNPVLLGPASESDIFHTVTDYHGHIKHYTKKEVEELMGEGGYELEFSMFEETIKRQTIKRIVKGIARRDRRYSSSVFYRSVRPLVFIFLKPFFAFLELISYYIENKNRYNQFACMSQVLVFKKN